MLASAPVEGSATTPRRRLL